MESETPTLSPSGLQSPHGLASPSSWRDLGLDVFDNRSGRSPGRAFGNDGALYSSIENMHDAELEHRSLTESETIGQDIIQLASAQPTNDSDRAARIEVLMRNSKKKSGKPRAVRRAPIGGKWLTEEDAR